MELTFRDFLRIHKSAFEMEFCTESQSHYATNFRDPLSIYESPCKMKFCAEPRSYYRSDLQLSHPRNSHSVVSKSNTLYKSI